MISILNYIKDILENKNISDSDKLEQIYEIASPIYNVKSDIRSAAKPVSIHLAKILIFGFKEEWCEHIQKNLNSLTIGTKMKLKKRRYPTKEEFEECIREPIEDEDEANTIIIKAIKEVKDEAKKRNIKYDEKIRDITPLEFLNNWNKFTNELSKIYIGSTLFKYKDIEKVINLIC